MHAVRLVAIAVLVAAATAASAAPPEPKTDEQKTLYAIGLALSNGLASFALTEAELELVMSGLNDGVLNRERKVDLQTYGPKIQELQKARASMVAAAEKKTGQAFLDKAAAEKGATKSASGLVMTTLKAGTGRTRRRPTGSRSTTTGPSRTGRCSRARSSARSPRFHAEPGHPLLDGGGAEDEGWRQEPAGLPGRDRVRRARRGGKSARARRWSSRWSCSRSSSEAVGGARETSSIPPLRRGDLDA